MFGPYKRHFYHPFIYSNAILFVGSRVCQYPKGEPFAGRSRTPRFRGSTYSGVFLANTSDLVTKGAEHLAGLSVELIYNDDLVRAQGLIQGTCDSLADKATAAERRDN
jgi:hypothetical protein